MGQRGGTGGPSPETMPVNTHCLSAKPPTPFFHGRVGNPLQIAVTSMIHAIIVTWEPAQWKCGTVSDVILLALTGYFI